MSTITINAPREICIPPTYGGLSQETWEDISFWNTRGGSVRDVENNRSEVRLPDPYMPLAVVDRWCSLGSEIFDYPCYFKITDPDAPCPFSTADPQETWNEWGVVGDSHKPIEIDDVWYRSNLYGAAGVPLVASAWYGYITTPADGIEEVLTVADFQAIRRPDPT